MISINGIPIGATIFPDGTSQVWHLPEELLQQVYKDWLCEVRWDFESEAEFIHLAQLKTLLDTYTPAIHLDMPYLPYARQDKRVENQSTFALATFARLLNGLGFQQVTVLDAHNNPRANAIYNLVDRSPRDFITDAWKASRADLIVYPDAGAEQRYFTYDTGPFIRADKVRDQATGHILNMTLNGSVKGKSLLIVDDLCDAGGTFKLVAERALEAGAEDVHLYVTHGLFTKGLQTLRSSGIKRIFTHKGEIR